MERWWGKKGVYRSKPSPPMGTLQIVFIILMCQVLIGFLVLQNSCFRFDTSMCL